MPFSSESGGVAGVHRDEEDIPWSQGTDQEGPGDWSRWLGSSSKAFVSGDLEAPVAPDRERSMGTVAVTIRCVTLMNGLPIPRGQQACDVAE